MSDQVVDSIVENYFRRLEALLSPIPMDRREQLIDELRDHVGQARSTLTVESAAAIHEIFERIGSPEEIAAEAMSGRSPRGPAARLRRVRDALGRAPSMTEERWGWIGAVAGLLFVLTFLVSKLMLPNAPALNANVSTITNYLNSNAHTLIASGLIGTSGAILFLVFLGAVHRALVRVSGGEGMPGSILLVAGTVFAVVGVLASVFTTTLAILANQSVGGLPGASYVSAIYLLRTVIGVGLLGLASAILIVLLGMALVAARLISGWLGLLFVILGLLDAVSGGAALVMGNYNTAWMVLQTVDLFGIAFVILAVSVVLVLQALPVPREALEGNEGGALASLKQHLGLTRVLSLGPWLSSAALISALAIVASIVVPLTTRTVNAYSYSPTTTSPEVATANGSNSNSSSASSSASVGYDGPAICAPTTDAATSGGSPKTLMSKATEVASGTIEDKPWSLWSAKGQTGAAGLEDGGVVFNGREYGLCAGYPNPSESEMIDTGGDAIIYGVVDYPGLATVQVSTGNVDSFNVGTVLPSPHVMIVNGISFYIGTLPKSACAYSYFEVNTTSPSYSTQHNIGFAGNGTGDGYSITNNPGNTGGCVSGRLDPLSYSQGVWQLPPGQFQSNSGGGGGSSASGSGSVSVPNDTSNCSPTTDPSTSGGPAASLMSTGTEVASGIVEGEDWSLWSAKGQSGAEGIEDGGLDLGGRAYGLCPGFPNPAELELIDTGSDGVVAGVVGYPGLATVSLSESTAGTFDVGQALPSPSVQVLEGVSFFIGTMPQSACDYSSLELNTTSPGVSAEHNLGFGSCVANELVPITESQGIWQLSPGQFQSNF